MNNSYKSIKQVLISILRITYNIFKFIAKVICSIIVFLLKVFICHYRITFQDEQANYCRSI